MAKSPVMAANCFSGPSGRAQQAWCGTHTSRAAQQQPPRSGACGGRVPAPARREVLTPREWQVRAQVASTVAAPQWHDGRRVGTSSTSTWGLTREPVADRPDLGPRADTTLPYHVPSPRACALPGLPILVVTPRVHVPLLRQRQAVVGACRHRHHVLTCARGGCHICAIGIAY